MTETDVAESCVPAIRKAVRSGTRRELSYFDTNIFLLSPLFRFRRIFHAFANGINKSGTRCPLKTRTVRPKKHETDGANHTELKTGFSTRAARVKSDVIPVHPRVENVAGKPETPVTIVSYFLRLEGVFEKTDTRGTTF